MSLGINGDVALAYAENGWSVFPLWWVTDDGRCACPGGSDPETSKTYCGRTSGGAVLGSPGKHPIPTVARNGVKNATRDPETITENWTRYPLAYPGLPAGANGLAIIDVDLDKPNTHDNIGRLARWAESRGVDLFNTLAADTGGGGLHLFFSAPVGIHAAKCVADVAKDGPNGCDGCIRNGQGNKPPFGASMTGIDTRGYGGYVVAPPSGHHSGGTYKWSQTDVEIQPWPEILTKLMELAAKPQPRTIARTIRGGDISRYAAAALDRELETLRSTQQGGRNGALNTTAFNLGTLVGAGLLAEQLVRDELLSVALGIGLTETESVKTIESGLGKGVLNPRQVPA
ncbi:MAG: bifunctional DNA primase/polymerase [Jiangellaceae bacterium]